MVGTSPFYEFQKLESSTAQTSQCVCLPLCQTKLESFNSCPNQLQTQANQNVIKRVEAILPKFNNPSK